MVEFRRTMDLGPNAYKAVGDTKSGKSTATVCVVMKDYADPPEALFRLKHPGLPEFYRFDGKVIYEFVKGASLQVLDLPAKRVLEVHASVASALGYLHCNGLCHGRVCPEHIIVRQNLSPVLVGFGHPQDKKNDFEGFSRSIRAKISNPGIGLDSLCCALEAGKYSDMDAVERELKYYANRL